MWMDSFVDVTPLRKRCLCLEVTTNIKSYCQKVRVHLKRVQEGILELCARDSPVKPSEVKINHVSVKPSETHNVSNNVSRKIGRIIICVLSCLYALLRARDSHFRHAAAPH